MMTLIKKAVKFAWCVFLTTLISIKLSMTLEKRHFAIELSIPLLYCLSLVIEFIITTIFIIGAHKKNPKLLRVYYIYGMVFLGIIFLLCLLVVGLSIYEYIMFMRFSFIVENIYETSIFGTGVFILLSLPILIFMLVESKTTGQVTVTTLKLEPNVHLPITIALNVIDVLLTVILLVGLHKKKRDLLKICFYAGVVYVLLTIIVDLAFFNFNDYAANITYVCVTVYVLQQEALVQVQYVTYQEQPPL
ncbi:hypothetical protein RR48_03092 [Papilio machaon]|uniref:Uncharacterized protein n=1 Tax=Papilio machaon TaxID=76193 RepID=A0A0N1IHD0_PAPMA|nr:hypothetical protein RR48_03092 [Papilio machaon]